MILLQSLHFSPEAESLFAASHWTTSEKEAYDSETQRLEQRKRELENWKQIVNQCPPTPATSDPEFQELISLTSQLQITVSNLETTISQNTAKLSDMAFPAKYHLDSLLAEAREAAWCFARNELFFAASCDSDRLWKMSNHHCVICNFFQDKTKSVWHKEIIPKKRECDPECGCPIRKFRCLFCRYVYISPFCNHSAPREVIEGSVGAPVVVTTPAMSA